MEAQFCSMFKRSERPQESAFVRLVNHILENDPYISSRQIGKKLQITYSTAIKILTENFGREYHHLRCVPLFLEHQNKNNRVDKTKIILKILTEARNSNFKLIINGYESWLFGTVKEKMDARQYDD